MEDVFLFIENGNIVNFGFMFVCLDYVDEVVDCSGCVVLLVWCDVYIYLVFVCSWEEEFVDWIKGLSYEEIVCWGGGIFNFVCWLQEVFEEEFFDLVWGCFWEVISYGMGVIEIKSGYGLIVESEFKMFWVICRLGQKVFILVKVIFFGVYVLFLVYKVNWMAYFDFIVNEMLFCIVEENLADYVDVFCEKGFFIVVEMECVMEVGVKYGLKVKVYIN